MSNMAQRLAGKANRETGSRVVHLRLSSIDFWSAAKFSFLISLAVSIAGIVLAFLLWLLVAQLGLFQALNDLLGTVGGNNDDSSGAQNVAKIFNLGRVLGLAALAGIVNVILGTLVGGLMAAIYNAITKVTGGIKVSLTSAK